MGGQITWLARWRICIYLADRDFLLQTNALRGKPGIIKTKPKDYTEYRADMHPQIVLWYWRSLGLTLLSARFLGAVQPG